MQQIIDFDNLEQVHYRNGNDSAYTGLTKVYYDGNLIWEISTSALFNFTGIDENGHYEGATGYDGTPVAYAVGKPNYSYSYYHYYNPTTPDSQSGYIARYVYNDTLNTWQLCLYDSSGNTLSPDWVEVGVTPCYNRETLNYNQPIETDKFYVYSGQNINYSINNGINSEFFNNFDFSSVIRYNGYPRPPVEPVSPYPDLSNYVFQIPDTYNGLPVTEILTNAFYGYKYYEEEIHQSDWEHWTLYYDHPAKIYLGNNIKKLNDSCCYHQSVNNSNDLSNLSIETIGSKSFYGSFVGDVILPSTVTSIAIDAFSYLYNSHDENVSLGGGLIISSPSITLGIYINVGLADNVNFLDFSSSVQNITGDFGRLSAYATTTHTNKIIFRHSDSDNITLNISSAGKSSIPLSIYTDNTYIRNYDFASKNYSVTFHPLSDLGE